MLHPAFPAIPVWTNLDHMPYPEPVTEAREIGGSDWSDPRTRSPNSSTKEAPPNSFPSGTESGESQSSGDIRAMKACWAGENNRRLSKKGSINGDTDRDLVNSMGCEARQPGPHQDAVGILNFFGPQFPHLQSQKNES